MSATVILHRSLVVRRFDLVATIAREQRRPELSPVLEWVRTRSEAGRDLNPKDLAWELLGRGAGMVTVAKRLLHICRSLRLVDDELTGLTEDGHHAVTSGGILRPEKGEWTVWACEDPLLPIPIVAISPKDAHTNGDDRRERRRDGPKPRPTPMPGWVLWAQGQAARMLADGRAARFDDISAPAIESPVEQRLDLCWTPSGTPEVSVKGAFGPWKRIDEVVEVDDLPSRDAVWLELLRGRRMDHAWDARRGALRIPFEAATTDDERLNMRTSLTFTKPVLERCGAFDDLTVDGISLCPDSHGSASTWARYQIKEQIDGVQTHRVFSALTDRVRTRFQEWNVQTPDREELAAELAGGDKDGRRGRRYWALQAALDWSL